MKVLGPFQYIVECIRLSLKSGGGPVFCDAESKEVGTVALREFKTIDADCSIMYESGWFIPLGANRKNPITLTLAERNPEPRRVLFIRAKMIPRNRE